MLTNMWGLKKNLYQDPEKKYIKQPGESKARELLGWCNVIGRRVLDFTTILILLLVFCTSKPSPLRGLGGGEGWVFVVIFFGAIPVLCLAWIFQVCKICAFWFSRTSWQNSIVSGVEKIHPPNMNGLFPPKKNIVCCIYLELRPTPM